MDLKKDIRGHTELNHGPIDLQSIALPLSYTPTLGKVSTFDSDELNVVNRNIFTSVPVCTLLAHRCAAHIKDYDETYERTKK